MNSFGAKGWGYLVLLYIYLIGIRFVLVFALYPLIVRIGIGANLREAVFMSYAGIRGAVGIALSLSLRANVFAGKLCTWYIILIVSSTAADKTPLTLAIFLKATQYEPTKYAFYRNDVVHLFGFVGELSI